MNFIEENCKTRRRCMPDNHPYVYDFCEKDSDNFRVEKTATLFGKHVVEFCLKNDGILVGGSDTDPPWRMKLTLTLNDEGSCRFKIDGKGEYMRWQVARRRLAPFSLMSREAQSAHNE